MLEMTGGKKVASLAVGCKVNQYESEAIAGLFARKGYEIVSPGEPADIYIINTCTVTNLGDKKSRQLIRRARRQNPEALVAAVGCYAQVAPEEVAKATGADMVLGTKDKSRIVELVESHERDKGPRTFVSDIREEQGFEELFAPRRTNRTRAYVKIEDGCDNFCSYCIIPYARGPVRSRPMEEILREAKMLAETGYKEIVLTGIHAASYGKDMKNAGLLDVIKGVAAAAEIPRIRLSSVEPGIITRKFVSELASMEKFCRHFHLSLQSGCDRILVAMNRRYLAADYERAVALIREYMPEAGLTTDIITGFPGETREDFQETMEFAERIGFLKIHVFPFSPKKGTKAAGMPGQIPKSARVERSAALLDLSGKCGERFISSQTGREFPVLFEEKHEGGAYSGYTPCYIRTFVRSEKDLRGLVINVKISGAMGENAVGEPVL